MPETALASGPEPAHWYAQFSRNAGFQPDPAQADAVDRLQALHDALVAFKRRPRGLIARTLQPTRQQPPRGLYLYGGVGRGKSALMDAFYAGLPYRRKRRVHFHAFMREVHEGMRARAAEPDPLTAVAYAIARATRVLCFDEFHVSDIADAMILSRLFEALFAGGVVLVITSNYAPSSLYPDGLQRERFLPAIALMEQRLDVLCVDGGVDHRMRTLEREPVFFTPLGSAAEAGMRALWLRATGQAPAAGEFDLLGRRVGCLARSSEVIWFSFGQLCGGPRSQLDYLKLAETHALLMLSGVPVLTAAMHAEARRFTWLVDILYDSRVPLALSAAAAAGELYTEGRMANEFVRTVSRLEEMQSAIWRQAAARA